VTREERVADAFVTLANSLVDDFDVVDLLTGLTSPPIAPRSSTSRPPASCSPTTAACST